MNNNSLKYNYVTLRIALKLPQFYKTAGSSLSRHQTVIIKDLLSSEQHTTCQVKPNGMNFLSLVSFSQDKNHISNTHNTAPQEGDFLGGTIYCASPPDYNARATIMVRRGKNMYVDPDQEKH